MSVTTKKLLGAAVPLGLIVIIAIGVWLLASQNPAVPGGSQTESPQANSARTAVSAADKKDIEFNARVRRFAAAYYSGYDFKESEYQELTTKHYRDTFLDPALRDLRGNDTVAVAIPDSNETDVNASLVDGARFATSHVKIKIMRGDEMIEAPYTPKELLKTVWIQDQNGNWRVESSEVERLPY